MLGVKFVLDEAVAGGDLGHPLCENVRQGDWLMDYSVNRLKMQPNVKQVKNSYCHTVPSSEV